MSSCIYISSPSCKHAHTPMSKISFCQTSRLPWQCHSHIQLSWINNSYSLTLNTSHCQETEALDETNTPILLISTANQNHPLFKLIKRSVTDKDVQDNENKIKLFNIIFQVLSISRVYVLVVLILHFIDTAWLMIS